MKRCYEILEIRPNASLDVAKQVFRDLVNIWHPDKYGHNPRLMEKAELKMKELNWAWDQFQAFAREQERVAEERRQRGRAEAEQRRRQREKDLMVLSELRTTELEFSASSAG